MKALIVTLLTMTSLICSPVLGVTLFQTDDFEGGSTEDWMLSTSLAPGGQGGPSDDFLSVSSTGGFNQGSRPAIREEVDWTGDFSGIQSIELDVVNQVSSSGPLNLRMVIFNGATKYTSGVGQAVPNDGSWNHYTFSLSEPNLTLVGGAATYATTITNVTRLMFRHDAGGPSGEGTALAATVGFDNITAVPEPSSALLGVLGLSALLIRRRRV